MKKNAYAIVLIFSLVYLLTMTANILPARADETIYIRADGSVDPPSAPISSADNITYTFTGNISDSIVVERSDIIIDGAGYTVEGIGNGDGINLYTISNVTIKNTNIINFFHGIYLESATYNTISKNNITANSYEGIELYYSTDNTITQNNITDNNWFGIGLYYSSNSNVTQNKITNNYAGIELYEASDNNISGNNLAENDEGIELYDSSDNSIFHNNFVNNTYYQVYTEFSVNVWDDGYPSGGNCWSDHTGADNYRGPSQNVLGSDGIYDANYIIDTDNQDNYPLTKPYGGYHDIGITNITTSKTIVGQGYKSIISTKIINYGINTETFSITAYANTTVIDQKQITLTSRNSTTATFTWNTSGFAKGSYVMSAYAWPIPDETDTADNNLADGTVKVGIRGDLNDDNKCNLLDLVKEAGKFGAERGDPHSPPAPKYDPNYDFDDNNKINLLDLVKVAGHFGETDP
jgi:parallel beta-helix repeat protein